MGNYRFNDDAHKKKQLPAAWRGIGCIMFFLLPTISYVAAIELLKVTSIRNFFYLISPSLFGAPSIHKLLWKVKAIDPFLREIYSWTNLEVNLVFGSLILLALSGFISLLYAIVFRAANPSRFGPTDAPPSRHKPTKKSR